MTPYETGKRAFERGDMSGLKQAKDKQEWWTGYLDAQTDRRLKDIFKRWNMRSMHEERSK